jgi:hypothetical protein
MCNEWVFCNFSSAFRFFNLVFAEIACFANTPRIQFAINVFTVNCKLIPALRVIAVAAEALRVVQRCSVLAFWDSRDAFLVRCSFLLCLLYDCWLFDILILLIATLITFILILNGLLIIFLTELRFLDLQLILFMRWLILSGIFVSDLIRLV